ncbi:MAG: phosphatase PAP2 family protein [Candidatus Nanoarchaeia archaeon]
MKAIIQEIITQITHLGSIVTYGVVIAFALLVEKYSLFWELVVSLAIILIIGMSIKFLYFKDRPQKQKYSGKLEKMDASSFPSIHSARITALAIILSISFNKTFLTIFLILVAFAVMYSRIYLKKHRLVDIIGGAILGGLSCLVILII